MPKKLVCGIFGTIYDAVMSKTPGKMTGNRIDRTDECIEAVASHMKCKADTNKDTPGFWQYEWPSVGTLTWETKKNENQNQNKNQNKNQNESQNERTEK